MFEEEAEEYRKGKLEEQKDKFVFELPEVYIKDIKQAYQKGAEFGYENCKEELTERFDIAIEIIEQMKDLFFTCWQEKGYNTIKFEQKVNDFLKENK